MNNTSQSTWLTVQQAADYCNVSTDVIYHGVRSRGLKHTRVGGKLRLRIKREWLDAWMDAFATQTVP